jgi:hypothetical protein
VHRGVSSLFRTADSQAPSARAAAGLRFLPARAIIPQLRRAPGAARRRPDECECAGSHLPRIASRSGKSALVGPLRP